MRASAKWGKAIGAAAVVLGLSGLAGCESTGEVQILDVAPRVGHTQGDQSVRILGKNFRQDIGYTVYFGKHKTSAVTIRDPETLEVLTPSGVEPGQVDIMIRTDDGAAFKIAQVFKFEEMGGSVVEGLGAPGQAKPEQKGNLAF
jgi:hypothetical protein